MIMIKSIILLLVFISATTIGILISEKYKNRVKDLKEMKNALNMFETKIKFTYEPIPEIFGDISKKSSYNIGNVFDKASKEMKDKTAGQAWELALDTVSTSLNEEDIQILKGLNKLLGKTDIEGQVSEIELTSTFLNTQIERAEKEQEKNEKLYKNLGAITGIAMVILLI